MNKSRDAKRGAGRFYRQIAKKSERAKKTRRLSCFSVSGSPSKEDCEMGSCTLADRGNDSSSLSHSQNVVSRNAKTKRSPISKRFFDGFKCVDHAPVPRRLRSGKKYCFKEFMILHRLFEAMKKRIWESASPTLPDSEKENHTLEGGGCPEKDVGKGTLSNFGSRPSPARQANSDGSPKSVFFQPITKDEEEAVETLFALAGMLRDNQIMVATELCREFSGANAPVVTEMERIPAAEPKENLVFEAAEVVSLNGTSFREQTELGDYKICHTAADNLDNGMLLSARADKSEENLPSFDNISINDELNVDSRLNQPQQQVILIPQEKMQEMGLGARTVESKISKLSAQNITKESGKTDLTLWPGLSSAITTGGASHNPSNLADAAYPTCLAAASSSDIFSGKEFSKAATDKNTLKRCGTHVHISQLIRALKMPENNRSLSLQAVQLDDCKVPKEKVFASLGTNRSNRRNNELDDTDTISRFGNFIGDQNFCEAEAVSTSIQWKKLHRDQKQIISASRRQVSTKQGFDFLPLSAGSDSIKAGKDGNVSGSSSHLRTPHLPSIVPCSAPQTLNMSCAHLSKKSFPAPTGQQVQLQLPLHLNSSLCTSFHENHSGISREQQQKQFCAAQVAERCWSTRSSKALNQFPSWLHAKHEHSAMIPTPQAIFHSPQMYMDTISTKYSTVAQHSEPLEAISSLRSNKVEERQLASLYEGGERIFQPGSALPLQLLCNESL